MKKAALTIALLLFAVAAHAITFSLGTPFVSGGVTYAPVQVSGLPDDMTGIGNIDITTTGTAAVSAGTNALGNVFPSVTGTVYYSNNGYYEGWHFSATMATNPCDAAAASGIIGCIPVTGSGTIAIHNYGAASGLDCNNQFYYGFTVNEYAVEVGGGNGGGGGGCCHEEGVTTPTRRSTSSKIKSLYR